MCKGLQVPIVVYDQIYSFDDDALMKDAVELSVIVQLPPKAYLPLDVDVWHALVWQRGGMPC